MFAGLVLNALDESPLLEVCVRLQEVIVGIVAIGNQVAMMVLGHKLGVGVVGRGCVVTSLAGWGGGTGEVVEESIVRVMVAEAAHELWMTGGHGAAGAMLASG